MNMSDTVDIIGYTTISGSKPLLNVMKATSTVNRDRNKPNDIVATITNIIWRESVKTTPQSSIPKITEIILIIILLMSVKTIVLEISL